jgi:hypothetical protein
MTCAILLSVDMPSVIMLSVVAPIWHPSLKSSIVAKFITISLFFPSEMSSCKLKMKINPI